MTRIGLFSERGSLLAAAAVLFLAQFAVAFSQEFPPGAPGQFEMMKADRYADDGDYEKAAETLIKLIEEDPTNLPAIGMLQDVYTNAKEYEKAIEVVGKIEEIFGRTTETCLSYGDLYLKMNSPEDAQKFFSRALQGNRLDMTTYPRIANIYRANGIYDKAIGTYLDARSQFDDPSLFSVELGQLYEVGRNYDEAAREYYKFMSVDTMNVPRAERMIHRLIEYVDDSDDMEELKSVFSEIADSEPKSFRPRMYLADMLIRQDSLERAYELYREIDHLAEEKGSYLVFFARRSLELDKPEIALRACHYVLDKYPNEPFHIQARYVLASAHILTGHADSAVADLQEVLTFTLDRRGRFEAEYEIGQIYLLHLKNPDSAMAYFDKVLESTQKSGWYHNALLRKGDCFLAKGKLATADSLYSQVDPNLLPSKEHEYLLWIRAQVKFFGHEFDDAKRLYADLTVKYPKGMSVNNCLRKILMINENTGFDRYDLGLLADAEYLSVRYEYDSAETKLASLTEKTGSNLADISAYMLGELYLSHGEPDKAIATFQRLISQFQDSFWRGEAQSRLADTYLAQGEIQKAQDAYLELLTNYDSVLLQEHAREKLKQIDNPQL